ncbi:hypothetical protein IWQ62_005058 [Dispira parvispora]|uniref:Geranylgeranyl pyrophosphate synthase n=1 Tax=Dispira parvispora TaxID=1520584 RepID=A0A9W8E5K8_9FUNG|nr:hypothetical protein IWQ62_005058 [Dispira parvispora]
MRPRSKTSVFTSYLAPFYPPFRASKVSTKSSNDTLPKASFEPKVMKNPLPPSPPLSTHKKSSEEILLDPYNYLLANPGKSFRTKFIQAFDYWLQVPKADLEIITNVIDMLHTSSLLIDDVEDDSQLRRGIPVAHKIFGVPATINSANYVYFMALQEILKMKKPELVTVFTEEMLALHEGQGMDLYWRDTLTCPGEDEYLTMVANKTGGLLRLAVKLMQHCSASEVDYVELVDKFGVYFQVRDDYMNLRSTAYSDNKGFCEDLQEGKFSFPVIHSMNQKPDDHQLKSILKQKTTDPDVKRYALRLMENTDSFQYTLEFLAQQEIDIRATIKKLEGNPYLEKAFDMLCKGCQVPASK